LSSKPAKAAETTETVPSLNWEKIPVWNIKFNIHFKSVRLVYIYTQAQIQVEILLKSLDIIV
jgi:hypothetical protein